MKHIPIALITGLSLMLAPASLLKAQDNRIAFNVTALTRFAVNNFTSGSPERIPDIKVNIKAVRNFVGQFKQTQNVNWYKVRDGYIVNFTHDGKQLRTGYDLRGKWVYNLASYPENQLPGRIWHQVRSTYYDFEISWVNEVKSGHQVIYIVHLKNSRSFLNVRVCEGEMEVMEELNIEPLSR